MIYLTHLIILFYYKSYHITVFVTMHLFVYLFLFIVIFLGGGGGEGLDIYLMVNMGL